MSSKTIETADLARKIGKIQAMVYCARQTVAAEKSHDCDMAANLLMAADNRLFAIKEALTDAEAA